MTMPQDDDAGDERTRVVGGAGGAGDGLDAQRAGAADAAGEGATVITSGAAVRTLPPSGAPAAGPHDADVLPAGSRLGEFEITALVGQGGFGAVYEAWDHTLERVVAIKEYLPVSLSMRQGDGTVAPLSERQRETFELGRRSFINEAKLLAQFDHPSLLKVYRFWQALGTAYMVMPFYRGDTLREALSAMAAQPGGVREDWLLHIMDGVTQALAVMHGAHCFHRDIAPDNIILLEDSGRPVVLDFGAARRVITDKTQAITVILKPGYAPVEQYAEMPDMAQGAWTDVYALAAVMHVAVTGRAPPPSVARLLHDSYVPLAGVEPLRGRYSPRLLKAIDAGLGVRPESRPQTMAALRAALGLEHAPAGGDDAVVPGGAGEATVILPRGTGVTLPADGATAADRATVAPRGGAGRWMGAVLALLLIAGGGAWWWLQQRAERAAPSVADAKASAPAAPASTPAAPSSTSTADTPSAPPPSASARPPAAAPAVQPTPPTPRTPAESLLSLADGASHGVDVKASAQQTEVHTGKDALAFSVRSSREGYVYVFLLSSGGELFLLFPNLLDKYNRIKAGETISLPRASWPMNAGGPAGVNRFAVLVSAHERDFTDSGMQSDGVFAQFSLPVLAALEAARGSKPPPLLGKPQCPAGAPCQDVYGVSHFNIVER